MTRKISSTRSAIRRRTCRCTPTRRGTASSSTTCCFPPPKSASSRRERGAPVARGPRARARGDRRGPRARSVVRGAAGRERPHRQGAPGGAGHRGRGARPAGDRAPRGAAAAQPPERCARALRCRSERGRPLARRGRGLRDRGQRGKRLLRRGRVPPPARDHAARSLRCRRPARPPGSGGPRARGLRGSAEPAGHGGLHCGRLQRWRRRPARGGHGRRQVVRVPGTGTRVGARERRAHHRLHQHDQPAGAARWQGPADSRPGAPDRRDERGVEVWTAVPAEPDLCPRLKCPHFDQCFLFQARRRAAEADVVVVNHHLLASDLAVRMVSDNWQEAAVLPPYRRLVLDEAHHLEDVAAMHLGAQVSMLGVQRLLSRLEKNGRGLLPTLRSVLFRRDDLLSAASRELTQQSLVDALAAARRAADDVFTRLARRLDGEPGPAPVLRLSDGFLTDAVWDEGLGVALDNLLLAFSRLSEGAAMIADRLSLDDPSERRAQLVGELRGVVRRLDAAAAGRTATVRPPAPSPAPGRWPERRGPQPPHVALAPVPLDLAPILKENLFDRVETVILTSATLAAGGEFGYLEERLGLDLPPSRRAGREALPSPVDFPPPCLFAVPTDLPEPRDDEEGHDAAVARVLLALAHASDGGMFVLFTSHGALRRTATAVRGEIGGRRPLLVQGGGQRDLLLRRFRDSGTAILLGTDSFWEGVDVPGRALRVLILAKLPFKVPSEPLTAARLERLEAKGLNGFSHYLVPN